MAYVFHAAHYLVGNTCRDLPVISFSTSALEAVTQVPLAEHALELFSAANFGQRIYTIEKSVRLNSCSRGLNWWTFLEWHSHEFRVEIAHRSSYNSLETN